MILENLFVAKLSILYPIFLQYRVNALKKALFCRLKMCKNESK